MLNTLATIGIVLLLDTTNLNDDCDSRTNWRDSRITPLWVRDAVGTSREKAVNIFSGIYRPLGAFLVFVFKPKLITRS